MSRNFIVYQSRNRLTNTLTQTLDTKHPESEIKFDAKRGRYAARCVEHKSVAYFSEHYPAGRAIAHVDEWCKKCRIMLAEGKRYTAPKTRMLSGEVTAKENHADMRDTRINSSPDKRWRERGRKRNVKAEVNRSVKTDSVIGVYTNPESDATIE